MFKHLGVILGVPLFHCQYYFFKDMVYFGFAIASSSNCNMQGYKPHNANHIKNMLNTEGIRRKRDLEQVENNKIGKEKNMHTDKK